MNSLKSLSLAILTAITFNAHAETLRVGSMSGQEAEIVYAAKEVAKKKFDLDVEVIEFDDYVTPNVALADGDIDANAFQHQPYLDAMNRDRGFDIVAVGNTFVYPIGAYSNKIKSLDELSEGMTIALPNDPSNSGRSYLLLHKLGIITLKDPNSLESSSLDVKDNPKKLKFQEVDAAQLPRVLDEVDVALLTLIMRLMQA
nr:MetQ/NlpA family ABC transporter substrate-binding protein [Rappaport israeli]